MIITDFKQLEDFKEIPGIYKFRFLTNFDKQYCGEGDDLYDRLVKQYHNEILTLNKNKKARPIIKAIKKYGWKNIEIEIIDYGEYLRDKNIRIMLETSCILEYNCLIKNGKGYNVCVGGNNTTGFKHSEQTKDKLRHINLGKKLSLKTCKKISQNHKKPHLGKHISEQHKKAIADSVRGEKHPNFGRIYSKEEKEQFSIYRLGKKHSEKTKKKMSISQKLIDHSSQKKSVKQIDLKTGEIIKIWDGARDTRLFLNKKEVPHITQCCKNKIKSAYGYKWEYA